MQVRIRIKHGRWPRASRLPATPKAPSPAPSETPSANPGASPRRSALGASSLVALGILASRITGLVRERVIAHYFGQSLVADAFRQAVRIPNLLNNLFGEGVLSASFITVYSKLRASAESKEAEELAQVVFGLLAVISFTLVLIGVLATPLLIDLIAPGFHGEKRLLTIRLVRILFPSTGMLVMSAWCLGVLNSHRQFLLSYMAPVAMNATMIAAMLSFGKGETQERLAIDLAWASVLGSILMFLVQLPRVLQLLPNFRPSLEIYSQHVQTVIRNFGSIFLSRGVVQISSYVDSIIASSLPTGAISALSNGQTIAVLPVSLFSMSISAAELPALSSAVGTDEEVATVLRKRLRPALRRVAFLIVPCAVVFLALGDIVAAALYQGGEFTYGNSVYTWAVLAGSAVGLLASSLARLYSSAFYALLDTKTPLRFAVVRITLTILLGILFALFMPRWLGIELRWGVAGLTVSAGLAGWVEFSLLRSALQARIGNVSLPRMFVVRLWLSAFGAAALAYPCKDIISSAKHPVAAAVLVLPLFGIAYFVASTLLSVPEAHNFLSARLKALATSNSAAGETSCDSRDLQVFLRRQ